MKFLSLLPQSCKLFVYEFLSDGDILLLEKTLGFTLNSEGSYIQTLKFKRVQDRMFSASDGSFSFYLPLTFLTRRELQRRHNLSIGSTYWDPNPDLTAKHKQRLCIPNHN